MGRTATGSGSGQASSATRLEISISIRGSEAPTKVWTLNCPAGGTLPHPARACRKLEQLRRPFALPKVRLCTQVYGGPEIADVRGVFHGRPVKAHFDHGNGCEIARWNRLRFLFPRS
jgi:subtilisin inhibitor-like